MSFGKFKGVLMLLEIIIIVEVVAVEIMMLIMATLNQGLKTKKVAAAIS